MTSLMSKRQQARNEKALQDLVQSVPGNNFCADCNARNPAWASWSLGVFLCMRCAAIHRKLGTHISKVKSLSMDGWSNDQVENMKRVGNAISNKKYNAQNKKPPVPIDADEVDSAMERFIRAKYMQSVAAPAAHDARRHDRASTESDEGPPPPLPPKTGGSFFKKSSATFPLSFRSRKTPLSPKHDTPQQLQSKPSKVFGASVNQDSPEEMAPKLSHLRDMGFADDKRNAMVLKGVNGNLQKAIEALVRLGEGGGIPPSLGCARQNSLSTSRSMTSLKTGPPVTPVGLSRTSPAASPSPATSNNPWDMPPAQPQSSQSTGTLQNRNPFYSTNPFGMPVQQAEFTLNQSLQNLSLTPSQQQLFPHHTGGITTPAPTQPQQQQQPMYQQSMATPVPQNQDFASTAFNNQTYQQPLQQPQQSYNPFLQAPASQKPPQLSVTATPFLNQGNNPFTRSPTRMTSPTTLNQIPEQAQQNFYSSLQSQTLNQIPEQSQQHFYGAPQSQFGNNPFFATGQPAQQQPQAFDQGFYQPEQQAQQAPAPHPVYQSQQQTKADILALYNYPSLAPTPVQQPQDQSVPNTEAAAHVASTLVVQTSPRRSFSTPLPAGNKNPFLNGGASSPSAAFSNPAPTGSARSRESMTLGMEMAWNNGRHSPDAFASLSARSS
ncbi:uncharacterized protein BCR38DRAFT_336264 [Pseudomassariella vexata]|uniref:Arf-GAP domain-containing protein n=1 Tax=Pseudomassariella vexata TaxID=1141098 RepID=A0A1Y2EBN8_9PEZI|nr:uncharacterized protein BCR38DRAFT_336264 [Pseudomassariella vexata]ORY68837.1 hypothetical protein BCR38DRAFT_336264 [Pseudomassariella vexata]